EALAAALLRRLYEDVSDAPDGADPARLFAVVPHFVTQMRDVDVERPVDARVVIGPFGEYGLGELFAGDCLAGATGEDHQHPKLEGSELELAPGHRRLVGGHVDHQVVDLQPFGSERGSWADPAEHGVDAGEKLAGVEWLRHVIVGADVETRHSIGIFAAR